jgi:hypothetical protein
MFADILFPKFQFNLVFCTSFGLKVGKGRYICCTVMNRGGGGVFFFLSFSFFFPFLFLRLGRVGLFWRKTLFESCYHLPTLTSHTAACVPKYVLSRPIFYVLPV